MITNPVFLTACGIVWLVIAARMRPPSRLDQKWLKVWRMARINLVIYGVGCLVLALHFLMMRRRS